MPLTGTTAELSEAVESALLGRMPGRLAVAVSGGSDSTALLYLFAEHARISGFDLHAVTVDHGLRREAASEASSVAARCKTLGVDHTILNWDGWNGVGNLQDRARRARYGLIASWAKAQAIETIALGHTVDDQAETFLMRLAREAGVDGLSGMAEWRRSGGVAWWRPLLGISRQVLRDYLIRMDIDWIDDPSNEDDRYDRIKARQVLSALAPLGIDAYRLSGVAANLRSAREALQLQTKAAAEAISLIDGGDVVFETAAFEAQPAEIGRRLLVHAIKWVSSAEYGPRGEAMADAHHALLIGKGSTLHGCRLLATKTGLRVTRELQAVKAMSCPVDAIWDDRWRLFGPENKGLMVRALGEAGLRLCPEWRDTGRPRASLLASPAVWRGDELLAAPLAMQASNWTASLIHPENHFTASVLSH